MELDQGDKELADVFSALANPVRLRILDQLREPKPLRAIEVSPERSGGDPDRTLARQTVRQHLKKLDGAGFIEEREIGRSEGHQLEYLLDNQRFFALAEMFRAMAEIRPARFPERTTRSMSSEEPTGSAEAIPHLLLLRGADEGSRFALDAEENTDEWVIGRRRDVEVPLDYDPYVSERNSIVRRIGEGYEIRDLPESRNGTRRNLELMDPGSSAPLGDGDLIEVGRSLLQFRTPD